MIKDVKTKLDKMNLVDKFLFDEVMDCDEAYEDAVSILLEREIHLLTPSQTEKELRVSPELRAARLDVVSMDEERQIYFTEMQKQNTYNLEKRSRYYQAQVDVSLLLPGEPDFNKLPNACFVLVAPFDIFGKGLYRYTFIGTCQECPELKLNDGAVRVFINTRGKNRKDFSQKFMDFMEYIEKTTDEVAERSKSERLKRIHKVVKKVKLSEKTGVKLMQTWEEHAMIREEGFGKGHSQGLSQGLSQGQRNRCIEDIRNLMKNLKLTATQAMEVLEVPKNEQEEYLTLL